MKDRYLRRIAGVNSRPGSSVEGQRFERVEFLGCSARPALDLRQRARISDVSLLECAAFDCHVEGIHLQDVVIDSLATNELRVCGSSFRNVIFMGSFGMVQIVPYLNPAYRSMQAAYDEMNDSIHREGGTAIDISRATGEAIDIRGIPSRYIRRNVETQAVMTFEQALGGAWRSVDLSGTPFSAYPKIILDLGLEDMILVANHASSNFSRQVAAIESLRRAGAVDFD